MITFKSKTCRIFIYNIEIHHVTQVLQRTDWLLARQMKVYTSGVIGISSKLRLSYVQLWYDCELLHPLIIEWFQHGSCCIRKQLRCTLFVTNMSRNTAEMKLSFLESSPSWWTWLESYKESSVQLVIMHLCIYITFGLLNRMRPTSKVNLSDNMVSF